jgi:ketosteroid isomerase-like protein
MVNPDGGDRVTQQKAVVERYTDGFRRGDLAQIVSCLSDDVVWEWHGTKTMVGKDAFAEEADMGDGPYPELRLERLIEEGETVAVIGRGSVARGGDPVDFVYSEVFTFTAGLISRLDTFHIWLGEVPA